MTRDYSIPAPYGVWPSWRPSLWRRILRRETRVGGWVWILGSWKWFPPLGSTMLELIEHDSIWRRRAR